MPGKRVQLDDETWQALDLLARDQMKTFQELADEAFADLLKKNGRPVDLKDALRRSADHSATVHQTQPKEKNASRNELDEDRVSFHAPASLDVKIQPHFGSAP
jgi:hypothetical protein